MRIAIVSPDPADSSGGIQRFCHTLRGVLTDLGAEATVLGIAEVDKSAHDLVVTNGMLGRPTTAPRIHVFHGCWVEHVRWGYRGTGALPWRARFLATGAAREIRAGWKAYRVAVSHSTAAEIRRWYRYCADRVIENCVDTDTFAVGDRLAARRRLRIPPDDRLALFIGRAEVRKRPDLAAAATAATGYRLLLAGSGTVDGATSLGTLTPAELTTWIQAVDCVVAPSAYEGCSLAILETLAAGTAVVASRVGWIPTLIERVPAYRDITAPADDVDQFTAALRTLPGRAQAVAEASRLVRDEYNLEKFAQNWAAAIEGALRARVPQTREAR